MLKYFLVKLVINENTQYLVLANDQIDKLQNQAMDYKVIYEFKDVEDAKNFMEQMQEYKSAVDAYNNASK